MRISGLGASYHCVESHEQLSHTSHQGDPWSFAGLPQVLREGAYGWIEARTCDHGHIQESAQVRSTNPDMALLLRRARGRG